MIYVVYPGTRSYTGTIVEAAFRRSFSRTQVETICPARWGRILETDRDITLVAVDPPDHWAELVRKTIKRKRTKLVLFGMPPNGAIDRSIVRVRPIDAELRSAAACPPAPVHAFSESALKISYRGSLGNVALPLPERAFLRFDFADEWNNLGYGAVRLDDSPWSLSCIVDLPDFMISAEVTLHGKPISAYAGLWDREDSAVLWFNRAVGPVDSQEWRLVEAFLSNHRYPDLPCSPSLREIPHGFDAAVTMRLDCDEDAESARPLWEMYRDLGVPFSLAIHTALLEDSRHHAIVRDVADSGGAVLSHSATHRAGWGGDYDSAFREAAVSADRLSRMAGTEVRYAVSPFHQTPAYARAALADAGYGGCIGGIVINDPDFLMARGGPPPGSPSGFVGHSQQCMLHGDCIARDDDPLKVFKEAFEIAVRGRTIFGYLDHPFSERYQYGWSDEQKRMDMHLSLIEHLRDRKGVLWADEGETLDYIRFRSETNIMDISGAFSVVLPPHGPSNRHIAVEYGGRIAKAEDAARLW